MALEQADIASLDLGSLEHGRGAGLLPVIVQHAVTGAVLMLGYMNAEAIAASLARRRLVFYSRSKQRLWEKGETSGNSLELVALHADCDRDTLLATALPRGPACHLGTRTCFGDAARTATEEIAFLAELAAVVDSRSGDAPERSYTARLLAEGPRRIAQKVGEEGVEVALAAVSGDDPELLGECADLLFHLLVLLRARDLSLSDVCAVLEQRHSARDPKN